MSIKPFLVKKTTKKYDAIVVGSGMSGGWAAKELCEQGLKVLLIERGRPVHHQTGYHTEFKSDWELPHRGHVAHSLVQDDYAVQRKVGPFNDATKHYFANDRLTPYQTAPGTEFDWIRANQLGGRSMLWARQCFRFSQQQFEENAKDGHGCDWPIRYADLAPWYSHVEKFSGISGSVENLPEMPDSEFLTPFDLNTVEAHLQSILKKKLPHLKMIHGRTANLSETTEFLLDQGRHQCHARSTCPRGCSFGAYFSTLSSTLPAAIKTQNLDIACHSVVHSLIYDKQTNRATGVNVIDEESLETREYHGNMIFMCASTVGTTQVLLNSKSEAFPTGFANSSGVLGHYLMDHNYNGGAIGEIEGFDEDYYKGRRPTGPVIAPFKNLGKQTEKFSRSYFYRAGAQRIPLRNGGQPETFGESLKDAMRGPGQWHWILSGSGEMLPVFENKMTLHKTLTDHWGLPQVVFDCKWGDNDKLMTKDMTDTAAEILEVVGAKNIRPYNRDMAPGKAIHEMGTARMGRDPNTSVLNAHNQCHDVPNVFVTDGSCMTSSGHVNPSLTYMAITARAANYAATHYKNKTL